MWEEKEHWKNRWPWLSESDPQSTHILSLSVTKPQLYIVSLVDNLPRITAHLRTWYLTKPFPSKGYRSDFPHSLPSRFDSKAPCALKVHTTETSRVELGINDLEVLSIISIVTAFFLLGQHQELFQIKVSTLISMKGPSLNWTQPFLQIWKIGDRRDANCQAKEKS